MILIRWGSEERIVAETDFPYAIGISRRGAVLWGGDAEHAPALWVRHHETRIYIQPDSGRHRVVHNGEPVEGSVWLSRGDHIAVGDTAIFVGQSDNMLTFSPRPEADETPEDEARSAPPPEPPRSEPAPDTPTQTVSTDEPVGATPPDTRRTRAPAPPRRSRRGLRAVAALFAVLLLGVGFVLGSSPVTIRVAPAPETVSLTGIVPPIPLGGRYLAVPGTYEVTAERQGYHPLRDSVTVAFGSKPELDYEMRKLPGRLTVTTTPVSDATVFVDGKDAGKTPLTDVAVEPGSRAIRIEAERYLFEERTLEIEGKGVRQSLAVTLSPGWGTLTVESEPPDMSVSLDDGVAGQTPLTFEPMAGDYRLTLSKDGWKPVTVPVSIAPGEVLRLPKVTMERIDGRLSLKSVPSGATVAVDGTFRGSTPLSLELISQRSYRVRLTKPGYIPLERAFTVAGAKTTEATLRLKPEYGIVFLKTVPSGATLKIDGKIVGDASRRLRLPTRAHRIEVSKKGYLPFKTTVTPRKGVSKRLNVRLKKRIDIVRERSRKGAKTKTGHVLKFIEIRKPVRISIGSSRRDPGRASNEDRYKVELTRSFMIGATEVTNAQFRRFRPRHESGIEHGVDLNGDNLPVASVTWDDAARYANWLSKQEGFKPVYREDKDRMVPVTPIPNGYRLPTEAEWVFAARYDGGQRPLNRPRRFTWGEKMPPPAKSGNFADSGAAGILPSVIRGYTDGHIFAAPVGTFAANAAGLYDLGGNVAEWCHDYYDAFVGERTRVRRDPTGPASGKFHVLRGSSWRHAGLTPLRLSFREYAAERRTDVGFRIARYVDLAK